MTAVDVYAEASSAARQLGTSPVVSEEQVQSLLLAGIVAALRELAEQFEHLLIRLDNP